MEEHVWLAPSGPCSPFPFTTQTRLPGVHGGQAPPTSIIYQDSLLQTSSIGQSDLVDPSIETSPQPPGLLAMSN